MLIEAAGCCAGSSPPCAQHLFLVNNKTRIKLLIVSRVIISLKVKFIITMAKKSEEFAEGGDGERRKAKLT